MKTALYHQFGQPAQQLHVVKVHKDGTVDLAYKADGDPVVTGCAVTETVVIGSCTAGEEIPTENKAPAAPKAKPAAPKAKPAAPKAKPAVGKKKAK